MSPAIVAGENDFVRRISGNALPTVSGRIHRSDEKVLHSVVFDCHALNGHLGCVS